MAWNYSTSEYDVGYMDGAFQLSYVRRWTISEIQTTAAGRIRFHLDVVCSQFFVYDGQHGVDKTDAYAWNSGADTASCDGESVVIFNSRRLNRSNVSYSTDFDIPNEWGGKTVLFKIAGDSTGISVVIGASRTYTVTTSAGTGSSIAVSRASSNVADTGSVSSGSIVYENDSLIISGIPSTNYRISSLLVNGNSFTSGNVYTVTGDVVVVATAQFLASDVGATDADIETISTITIVRYDNNYVHTLEYSFGNLNGYITESGGTSTSRQIITGTSVPFTVPSEFYTQIPNAQTALCTITCKTYANSTSTETLGDPTTCTFTARTSASRCSPTVSGAVVDTNPTTIALTQDSRKIVRYMSIAQCTITASARNSATIVERTINGAVVPNGENVVIISGDALTNRSIRFTTTDSRGLKTVVDVPVDLIPYVKLTCNPELKRNAPTDGNILLSITGKMYTGADGWRSGVSNMIFIQYRYRVVGTTTFSDWTSVTGYVQQNDSYKLNTITLTRPANEGGYDYRSAYEFEFKVTDGDGTNVCSTVMTTVVVQQGIPVFDWGKNDFRFNVPIYIGNTKLTEAQLQSLLALIS